MKTESRILLSIRQRPGAVLLRSDVAGLGSASQVSESLKALQNKGFIVRVGSGIYAKSVKAPATGAIRLMASAEDIAVEVFKKLGVAARITPSDASHASAADALTLNTGPHRINRRLSIAGNSVVYVHQRPGRRKFLTATPLRMPKRGVSQFVARLARKHQITYVRTAGDALAEAATRLAGDEVESDATGNLLVALKRAHKLSDREMATLLVHHRREMNNQESPQDSHVRSV